MKITVLGAGRCVTGSKFLLEWKNFRVLIDSGLFQGPAKYRQLNWKKLPIPPHTIDAVVLTHAHIDHSGYLPRLCRQGFEGPVFCTPPTRALLGVLLPDAAHINEEEARYANKKGYSKHKPALPLFRMADARAALKLLESAAFDHWHELHPGIRFRYHRQGHILGAAAIELETKVAGGEKKTIYFSGDVGRYGIPILHEPQPYPGSDVLFVETTYGDRFHGDEEPRVGLGEEVRAGIDRGGVIIIPAFAIDRTQEILYLLHELMVDGDSPEIPIYLDSPMGIEARCGISSPTKRTRSSLPPFTLPRHRQSRESSTPFPGRPSSSRPPVWPPAAAFSTTSNCVCQTRRTPCSSPAIRPREPKAGAS
ncbi:MAG: MBL fold metallo-hydrolase [Acidobacteriota bacterium]